MYERATLILTDSVATSAESRGFPPGTPVSSHRES